MHSQIQQSLPAQADMSREYDELVSRDPRKKAIEALRWLTDIDREKSKVFLLVNGFVFMIGWVMYGIM